MLGFFKKSQKAADPICLMKIDKSENALNYKYKGETYYFCSENCQNEFKNNPDKYLNE